jgi:4'-phosphopantetheinyl transferase
MSIRVYSIGQQDQLPAETFRSLLTFLPADLAGKVQRYRRWQDAQASLFGKLLLAVALKEYGCSSPLSALQYSAYGRPYLSDGPDFNISHSGHRVVCIIAQHGKVGIDLEEIRPLDFQDFKVQFSPEEWDAINHDPKPLRAFYHYWTAKECLSKVDGRGLNLPLAGIRIMPGETRTIQAGQGNWYLRPLDFFDNYACHIAAGEPLDRLAFKHLNINELMEFIAENRPSWSLTSGEGS